MRINKKLCALLSAALVLCACGAAPAKEAAHERRIRLSAELIGKMAIEHDADALADVIKSGKGVAIFPAVAKAGFIVGAQSGEGLVLLRNPDGTWSGPAFMGINGASVGFQIGAQAVGLVLVITNQDGLRAFTGGNSFKLGLDVAVAAGPVGRDTSTATDGRAQASIYSYSMAQGIFAGVSIDGCVINQNRDANKAYWGKDTSAQAALQKPANGKKIQGLVKALDELIKKAK